MNLFNIIAGLASITGFIITVFGIMPEYKAYWVNFAFVTAGLALGSVYCLFKNAQIKIYRYKPQHLFAYITLFLIAIGSIYVLSIMPTDELVKTIGSLGVFIAIILIFVLKDFFKENNRVRRDDLIVLSKHHATRGDYLLAIRYLEDVLEQVDSEDEALVNTINATIKEYKSKV